MSASPDTSAATTELAELAQVLVIALGLLLRYWEAVGMVPTHPYRQAACTLDRYLRRRYRI